MFNKIKYQVYSSYFLFLFLWLTHQALGQGNFRQSYLYNGLPIFNFFEYEKPKIVWDMPGHIQRDLNQSINLIESGEIEQAAEVLNSMIKRGDRHWAIYYFIGVVKNRMFRFAEANNAFNESVLLNPKTTEAYLELGKTYIYSSSINNAEIKNRNLKIAQIQFKKAINLDDKKQISFIYAAGLEILIGNNSRAKELLNLVESIDKENHQSYYLRAIIELTNTREKEAMDLLNQVLNKNQNYVPALLDRIGLNEKNKNYKEVINDLNTLIRLNPSVSILRLNRAYYYTLLEEYDLAFIDFKKVFINSDLVGLDNEYSINEEAFSGDQSEQDRQVDWKECIDYQIRTIAALSEIDQKRTQKAICLGLIGEFKEAFKATKNIYGSRNVNVILIQAILLEQSGNHNIALKLYKECLELDNNIFLANKKLSIYMGEFKKYDSAFLYLKKMDELRPENNFTHKLRGIYLFELNRFDAAERCFNRCLKTDSTNFELLKSRAITRDRLNKKQLAFEDLYRSLKIKPDESLFLYFKNLAVETNNTEKAIPYFLNLYQENDELDAHYLVLAASTYTDLNDYENAKTILKPIFSKDINLDYQYYFEYGRTDFFGNSLNGRTSQIVAEDFIAEFFYTHTKILIHENKLKDALKTINYTIDKKFEYMEGHYIRAKIYLLQKSDKAYDELIYLSQNKYKDSEKLLQEYKANKKI